MTVTKKITVLISLLFSTGLMFSSCADPKDQDAVTYINKLMNLMNNNQTNMLALNATMTSGHYDKAEKVRQDWVNHLNDAIKKAEAMDDFNGNNDLKEAVENGLKEYKEIATDEYKQLIYIRKSGNSTQTQKENKLLNEINKTFQEVGNEVNTANGDFQIQYAPE